MTDIVTLTVDYFRPPKNYFWRWAEKGEVIEWQTGSTICYRDELVMILQGLAPGGLPPLGSLLLALAACQHEWKQSSGGIGILHGILWDVPEESGAPGDEILEYYIQQATRFMDVINGLPRPLRSGTKKIHLLHDIFRDAATAIPADQARSVIDEWSSGRLDKLLVGYGEELTREQFKADLEPLDEALRQFPNPTVLELFLRVGVEKLPQPAEVNLPEPEPLDLLDQLAEDAKTRGIAQLTKRLVAAIHIPMHTQGSGDQPYGGVSDITNRGNFDRLLLSELAQDELVLAARLVNNEALFLRREEPPEPFDRQRIILVDTTLKMWGLPRIFAISATLACARKVRPDVAVQAYALGGVGFQEIDIASKEGVIQTLECLDPAWHCGDALQSFIQKEPKRDNTEYILISDAHLLHDPALQAAMAGVKQSLNLLITVDRTGELQLYEYRHGRRSLLSTSQFDLEALLAPANATRQVRERGNVPAFLSCEPVPLYFPTAGMRLSDSSTFYAQAVGVIGVTEVQRLLYWPQREIGAREVLPYIEPGNYWFGFDGEATVFILVNNRPLDLRKLYKIHLRDLEVEGIDLSNEIGQVTEAAFHNNLFFIQTSRGMVLLEAVSGKVDTHQDQASVAKQLQKHRNKFRQDFSPVKKHINNGYTVLQRVQQIYVNAWGELSLDQHSISLFNNSVMKLSENRKEGSIPKAPAEEPTPYTLTPNKGVKFRKTVWADGSEAILDSRGLLHLRSSDTMIPEITLVLVIGKALSGWASDGTLCGSYYFTGVEPSKSMPAPQFYTTYLKRFIDRLPTHATETTL